LNPHHETTIAEDIPMDSWYFPSLTTAGCAVVDNLLYSDLPDAGQR
jgi:hypothetical protein